VDSSDGGLPGDEQAMASKLQPKADQVPRVTASLVANILRITGTDQNDDILVKQVRNLVTVLSNSKVVQQFSATLVKGIEVHTFAGDDTVDLRGAGRPVHASAWVYGGDGNNKLFGSNKPCRLFGGNGDDTLNG
jgi:Ca2+-binding RTX toxin-like protein